jgi:hypothetical protein
MSKHTPGPWAVEQDGPWTLVRGYDVELQSEDYPGPLVCTPAENGCTQANARLIAAAPDLLAVCKRMVVHAGIDMSLGPAEVMEFARIHTEMRAAIAKAEGVS